jgi:hypothetical protein
MRYIEVESGFDDNGEYRTSAHIECECGNIQEVKECVIWDDAFDKEIFKCEKCGAGFLVSLKVERWNE